MSTDKFLAIGDIHGCLQTLNRLLKRCDDYKDHTFIFIGDYIDRGPDSKGVVERLLAFKEEQNCIFLRGNHEQMLLDSSIPDVAKMWLKNGGKETLASYNTTLKEMDLPETHLKFYKNTRMYYDTPDYFFVHAGLSPNKTIAESLKSREDVARFLWERSHLNNLDTSWEKPIVFGHTPRPQPIRKPKMFGIDTGCVYNKLGYGKLTAMTLPEEKIIQQFCLDN